MSKHQKRDPTAIRATSRLFKRTPAVIDLDGWAEYIFPEVDAPNPVLQSRLWTMRISPGGVRYGKLQVCDAVGRHTRLLRRIEEDHLMKFAIRA